MNPARRAVDVVVRARLLTGVWSQSYHYAGKLPSRQEQLVSLRRHYDGQGDAYTSFLFAGSIFCVYVCFSTTPKSSGNSVYGRVNSGASGSWFKSLCFLHWCFSLSSDWRIVPNCRMC